MSTTTVPNPLSDNYEVVPLPGASFGGVVRLRDDAGAKRLLATAEENPSALTDIFYACGGLLLLPGMHNISEEPELLVRLSRLFGREVENNLDTYTEGNQTLFNIHQTVPEILLVSNLPPICRQPMARPDPPLSDDGKFPTRFPHRRGWHTDQSFRRPPPDISLFYAVRPTPKGQGQTMFADGTGAYSTLPASVAETNREPGGDARFTRDESVGIRGQARTGTERAASPSGTTTPAPGAHTSGDR